MINEHEFIVFAKEHYNALGLVRALGKNNINPIFIALKGKGPAALKSCYIKERIYVSNLEEGLEVILKYCKKSDKKPFVLTSDDMTQGFLDKHFDDIRDLCYFFNAGEQGRISHFMDKEQILLMAEKHGLDIPDTRVTDCGIIPNGLSYPIITKSMSPNIGGWKSDVFICENEIELNKAFSNIRSPRVIVQQYIDKINECCVEGISINHGRNIIIPMAIRYNYNIPGYYSPYMTAYYFDEKDIMTKIRSIMEDIGYEGLFDVEFILDGTGNYHFMEINFRNSIWDYIGVVEGISFPIIWAQGMLTGEFSKQKTSISKEYTAMVEPIDYKLRVKEGKTPFGEWLADFRNADVLFYYDKDDIEPYKEMINNMEVYA